MQASDYVHVKKTHRAFKLCTVMLPYILCTLATKCACLSIIWQLLTLDDSPLKFALALSLVSLMESVFTVILSPINDKFGATRVYSLSIVFSVLVSLAAVAITELFQEEAFLFSLLAMIFLMAASSLRTSGLNGVINETVPIDDIQYFLQIKLSLVNFIAIAAPLLAAMTIAKGGVTASLIASACFFALSAVIACTSWNFVLFNTHSNREQSDGYVRNLIAGLNALFQVKTELYLGLFSSVINLIVAPFFSVLLPLFVIKNSEMNVTHLGFIEAFFALGAFFGAYKGVTLLSRKIGKRACIITGYLGLSGSMILFSIASGIYEICVLMIISGFSLPLINTHLITLRILATPDKYVSRISGAVAGLCMISIPIGNALYGVLLDRMPIQWVSFFWGSVILTLIFPFVKIPNITLLLQTTEENELKNRYAKLYPDAFS